MNPELHLLCAGGEACHLLLPFSGQQSIVSSSRLTAQTQPLSGLVGLAFSCVKTCLSTWQAISDFLLWVFECVSNILPVQSHTDSRKAKEHAL